MSCVAMLSSDVYDVITFIAYSAAKLVGPDRIMSKKRLLSKVDDFTDDLLGRMSRSIQHCLALKERATTALQVI